jgi:hypothetical protein
MINGTKNNSVNRLTISATDVIQINNVCNYGMHSPQHLIFSCDISIFRKVVQVATSTNSWVELSWNLNISVWEFGAQ